MWNMLAVMGRRKAALEDTTKLLFYVSVGVFVGVLSCANRMTRPKGSLAVNASIIVRGLVTAVAFGARFMSLHQLRLVDQAVVTSMAPVLSWLPTLLSTAKRHPAWFVFLVTALAASVLLVLYDSEEQRVEGLLWALLSACLGAAQELFTGTTSEVPQAVLLLHSSFIALISSSLLAGFALESPRVVLTQVDMNAMAVASQLSFAYIFFVSKARETDRGLANMFKYTMDVLMACALGRAYLPDERVPPAGYVAAFFCIVAVVSAELQRISMFPSFAAVAPKIRFFM